MHIWKLKENKDITKASQHVSHIFILRLAYKRCFPLRVTYRDLTNSNILLIVFFKFKFFKLFVLMYVKKNSSVLNISYKISLWNDIYISRSMKNASFFFSYLYIYLCIFEVEQCINTSNISFYNLIFEIKFRLFLDI